MNKTFILVKWNNCCFLNFQSNLITDKFKYRGMSSRKYYQPNSYFLRVLERKTFIRGQFYRVLTNFMVLHCF